MIVSKSPEEDIKLLAYPQQPPDRRMYRYGYERYLEEMPEISDDDMFLSEKNKYAGLIMDKLQQRLSKEDWYHQYEVDGEFKRTILALVPPVKHSMFGDGFKGQEQDSTYVYKSMPQIMLGHVGKGMATPVHGHQAGFMYETMVTGKIKLDRYRLVDEQNLIVRLEETEIHAQPGVYSKTYSRREEGFERKYNLHKITALEHSELLLYFPEYSRDSINSTFTPEYFDDVYNLSGHVDRLETRQAMNLERGTVLLIRSKIASDYGDHYLIADGGTRVMYVGNRPNAIAIISAYNNTILNSYSAGLESGYEDVVILKLDNEMRNNFINFHNIQL